MVKPFGCFFLFFIMIFLINALGLGNGFPSSNYRAQFIKMSEKSRCMSCGYHIIITYREVVYRLI